MTAATRTALERVSQILRDAGWARAGEPTPPPADAWVHALRQAYGEWLRDDDLTVIREVCTGGAGEPAAAAVSRETLATLPQAFARLRHFVEDAQAQLPPPSRN